MLNKNTKVSKPDFWQERYQKGTMPWDIGQVAPAFVKYFRPIADSSVRRFAVLGCGRGHDAFFFAGKVAQPRFQVYGFDFSENAVNFCSEIKEKENIKNVQFIQADFFELTKDKKWKNFFDVVIEHTSLAAIDPSRRIEYVNLIKYLLKPSGKLIGLFFIRPKELGGPPFGISTEEVRKLFKDGFVEIEKLHYEECLHGDKLRGDEWFGVFGKKN